MQQRVQLRTIDFAEIVFHAFNTQLHNRKVQGYFSIAVNVWTVEHNRCYYVVGLNNQNGSLVSDLL